MRKNESLNLFKNKTMEERVSYINSLTQGTKLLKEVETDLGFTNPMKYISKDYRWDITKRLVVKSAPDLDTTFPFTQEELLILKDLAKERLIRSNIKYDIGNPVIQSVRISNSVVLKDFKQFSKTKGIPMQELIVYALSEYMELHKRS